MMQLCAGDSDIYNLSELQLAYVKRKTKDWQACLAVEVAGPVIKKVIQQLWLLKVGDSLSFYSIPQPRLVEHCIYGMCPAQCRHEAHGLLSQRDLQQTQLCIVASDGSGCFQSRGYHLLSDDG